MKSPLKDFLEFSRVEQVGLMVLVTIVLVSTVVLNFHDSIFPLPEKELTQEEIDLLASLRIEEENQQKGTPYAKTKRPTLPTPFQFDPNSLSEEGYERLGFSVKQAQSIRKYFDKGGRIENPEDFKKLYVVNDFMYERLKGFIVIEAPSPGSESVQKARIIESKPRPDESADLDKPIPVPILDLNDATKEQLMALPGIGPIYATRILAYKDLLGGYSSVDQLHEVYGLKDNPEIITSLYSRLKAAGETKGRIDINTAEWKDLVRHPYIDKNVANSIVKMRENHGSFKDIEDILESHLIDEPLFQKISPYLMVIDP